MNHKNAASLDWKSSGLHARLSTNSPRSAWIIRRNTSSISAACIPTYDIEIGGVPLYDIGLNEILDFVSEWDLERFENSSFQNEIEEQARLQTIATLADQEERQTKRRLKASSRLKESTTTDDPASSVESDNTTDDIVVPAPPAAKTDTGRHGRPRPTYSHLYPPTRNRGPTKKKTDATPTVSISKSTSSTSLPASLSKSASEVAEQNPAKRRRMSSRDTSHSERSARFRMSYLSSDSLSGKGGFAIVKPSTPSAGAIDRMATNGMLIHKQSLSNHKAATMLVKSPSQGATTLKTTSTSRSRSPVSTKPAMRLEAPAQIRSPARKGSPARKISSLREKEFVREEQSVQMRERSSDETPSPARTRLLLQVKSPEQMKLLAQANYPERAKSSADRKPPIRSRSPAWMESRTSVRSPGRTSAQVPPEQFERSPSFSLRIPEDSEKSSTHSTSSAPGEGPVTKDPEARLASQTPIRNINSSPMRPSSRSPQLLQSSETSPVRFVTPPSVPHDITAQEIMNTVSAPSTPSSFVSSSSISSDDMREKYALLPMQKPTQRQTELHPAPRVSDQGRRRPSARSPSTSSDEENPLNDLIRLAPRLSSTLKHNITTRTNGIHPKTAPAIPLDSEVRTAETNDDDQDLPSSSSPSSSSTSDVEGYEIERITGHHISDPRTHAPQHQNRKPVMLFRAKWVGYDGETWEPRESFAHDPRPLVTYYQAVLRSGDQKQIKLLKRAVEGFEPLQQQQR